MPARRSSPPPSNASASFARNFDYVESRAAIQVYGNIDAQNAARLATHGATHFGLGTCSIFKPGNLAENLHTFTQAFEQQRQIV